MTRSCPSATRTITCGTGRDHRYLLEEFVADLSGGHNVRQTVYVECGSMYSATEGREAFRCVGETEFAQGIAAQSASGQYGPALVAAGIVAYANLIDSNADEVIQDHFASSDYRFHGVRFSCAWDDSPAIAARRGTLRGCCGMSDFAGNLMACICLI